MVQLDIPYTYAAEAIPRRASTPRTFRVVDTIRVDVPEVVMADLPVAGRLVGPGSSLTYHLHAGHFLAPRRKSVLVDAVAEASRTIATTVANGSFPVMPISSLARALDPFSEKWNPLLPTVMAGDLPMRVREIASSNDFERRQRMLDDVAPRLCIIGNGLHYALDEPVWGVKWDEDDEGHRTARVASYLIDHDLIDGHVFRIDHRDDALAFWDVPPERHPDYVFEDAGTYDWSFDETANASRVLTSKLETLMQNLHFGSISANPADFFAAYCKLRDWQDHDVISRQDAATAFLAGLPETASKEFKDGMQAALGKWRWIAENESRSSMQSALAGFHV